MINGVSPGIQIAPPFRWDLTGRVYSGANRIAVEIATTLERERADAPAPPFQQKIVPVSQSGLTGQVHLYLFEGKPETGR